jgi:hypothetical protein
MKQTMPESKLIKRQNQTKTKTAKIGKRNYKYKLELRYDDNCGNGHNTFSLTMDTYVNGRHESGGCCHDEAIKIFPEYAHLIKWHLVSSDGPMHYIANTTYHASKIEKYDNFVYLKDDKFDINELLGIYNGAETEALKARYDGRIAVKREPNYMNKDAELDYARSSAVWPDATLEQLSDKDQLKKRLPALMQEFKADMEKTGFTY